MIRRLPVFAAIGALGISIVIGLKMTWRADNAFHEVLQVEFTGDSPYPERSLASQSQTSKGSLFDGIRTLSLKVGREARSQMDPTELKRLVDDANDIIRTPYEKGYGISVAGGSFGINSYMTSIYGSDGTLADKAIGFYSEINKIDQKYAPVMAARAKLLTPIMESLGNPALVIGIKLGDAAGIGPFLDLQPGWVWRLAEKAAHADPQTAMRLIGLCGHDDIMQEIDNPKLRAVQFDCPSASSVFYVPRGLDSSADISDLLKEKLLRVQSQPLMDKKIIKSRDEASRLLPAKYYHVYGSAFVACELVRRRHPADQVISLEKFLAEAYRAAKLSHLISRFKDDPSPENQEYRDAASLVEHWTTLGSLVPTNWRFEPADESTNRLVQWLFRPKPKGWTQERFEKAKKRFNTWMIDFDWTIQQHLAGAEFGARVCKI